MLAGSRALRREGWRFLLVAAPKLAGGLFLVLLNALLIQIVEPADYGLYAVAITLILLIDAIMGASFDLAIIRLRAEGQGGAESDAIERAALHLKLGLMALAALLAALGGTPLSALLFDSTSETHLILLSCFAGAALLALRSVLVHLQIEAEFLRYALVESFHIAVKAVLIGMILAAGWRSIALILMGLAIGPACAALAGGALYVPRLFAGGEAAYRLVLRTVRWFAATIAIGALIGRLDILMLAGLATIGAAGAYGAGQFLAALPELFGSYIGVVLTARLVASMRGGDLRRFHQRFQPPLGLAAAAFYLVLFVLWDSMIAPFFPPSYALSGDIAFILLPAGLAAFATVPLALPIVMMERQRALISLDAVLLPIVVASYWIVIPRFGALGAAYVASAVSLFRSLAVQIIAFRIARTSPAFQG
jgi:O-antigen/teichoic acid export membrane protein